MNMKDSGVDDWRVCLMACKIPNLFESSQ